MRRQEIKKKKKIYSREYKRLASERCRRRKGIKPRTVYVGTKKQRNRQKYLNNYKKHRAKILARSLAWKKNNKDRVRSYRKAWERKNTKRTLATKREWYRKNRIKFLEQRKVYVKNNRKKIKQWARKAYLKRRSKILSKMRKKYARTQREIYGDLYDINKILKKLAKELNKTMSRDERCRK